MVQQLSLHLPMQGVQVRSLVRALRYHISKEVNKSHGEHQYEKKKKRLTFIKKIFLTTYSMSNRFQRHDSEKRQGVSWNLQSKGGQLIRQ